MRTGSLDVHAHPSSCIMSGSLLSCYCHYRHNGQPHISVKGCVRFTVGRSSFLTPNSSGKALNKHSQPTTNSLAGPEGRPVLHSPLNTEARPHFPFAFYQQLQKGGRGQFLGTKAGLGCQWPSQKHRRQTQISRVWMAAPTLCYIFTEKKSCLPSPIASLP